MKARIFYVLLALGLCVGMCGCATHRAAGGSDDVHQSFNSFGYPYKYVPE